MPIVTPLLSGAYKLSDSTIRSKHSTLYFRGPMWEHDLRALMCRNFELVIS